MSHTQDYKDRDEYERMHRCRVCQHETFESEMLKCKYCDSNFGYCLRVKCKEKHHCFGWEPSIRHKLYRNESDKIPFCNDGCMKSYYKQVEDTTMLCIEKEKVEKEIKNINEYYDLITKYTKINKIIEKVSTSEANLLENEYKSKEMEHSILCRQRLISLLNVKFEALVECKPKMTKK
jgi:hypothetical protein